MTDDTALGDATTVLIATRVMEWHRVEDYWCDGMGAVCAEVETWAPDRNIADAWLVVEKLRADGSFFDLGDKPSDPDDMNSPRVWNAFINRTTIGPDSETPALAICRAALKSLGISDDR